MREQAVAGHGEQLPRCRVDQGEEGRDQTEHATAANHLGQPRAFTERAVAGHRRVQRIACRAHEFDTTSARCAHQHHQSSHQQSADGRENAAWHGATGVFGFFRCRTGLLDGDEQPDGERHAGEDTAETDRGCDIGRQRQQVGQFDMRRHGHAEGQQGDDSDHPGNERQAHGLTDAAQVNADDHHEQGDLHRPATDAENRFGVGTNERRRRAGADGQGQRASHADQITHERPEGTLRIDEHTASARQRRGQFRHTQRQPATEQGHQQRGDQHVQPATGRQPEVPAGKLPGHHQRNSEAGNLWPAQRTFLEHKSLPRPEGRFIVLVRNGGGSAFALRPLDGAVSILRRGCGATCLRACHVVGCGCQIRHDPCCIRRRRC
ncbi:hypothetical protein D3C86_970470 [compost metagenome]